MQVVLDEPIVVEENELPPQTEIEEYMAENRQIADLSRQLTDNAKETKADFKDVQTTFKTISGDVNTLRTSIQTVSTHINWIMRIGTPIILAVAGILVYYNISLGHLAERIATLEGRGGSYAVTEKSLVNSNDPVQVSADLSLLQAQIQKRAASGDPLTPLDLAKVGVTVNSVSEKFPDLPNVWSASSHLVNLRFDRTVPTNLPNCWSLYKGHSEDGIPPLTRPAPSNYAAVDEQKMGNCELTLDDGPEFRESGFGLAYARNLKDFPAVKLQLTVHDAVITYSGGKLIPFNLLLCRNCIFRTTVRQSPTPDGQRVIRHLLIADTSRVQIAGPQSGE